MLTAARRHGAAAVLAAVFAAAALLAGAAPARADGVRNAQMWVLDTINAPAAWPVTKGAGVTVAVIDSGVDGQVSDLVHSVRSGPDYTGVGTPASSLDWGVHGTWMASLIAGHGHDGGTSGILGSAPASTVLSIRVITDRLDPGYTAYEHESLSRGQHELARAIRYAVSHRAGVISMSLGYGAPSRSVRSALQDAYAHDVVVVASSGNSGSTADQTGTKTAPYSFPASYPGVLGVAAVGPGWAPASFSSENFSVQVAAPGVNVPAQGRDGQYWLVSGTSPACALTAGVAALVKSRYPGLSDAQVITAITRSTWHRPGGGYDKQVGFGTVDAVAALSAAGRLARQGQVSHTVAATSHFGGGPQAVPAPPVSPRGPLSLLLFSLLAVACLAAIILAAVRLAGLRQPEAAVGPAPRRPLPPTPGWGLITADPEVPQPSVHEAPTAPQPAVRPTGFPGDQP
ncbi:MAG TPA: S8 family serine peptidase [Streptosporangiaceae bacterium]|jgi:subtilisin family serine protease